MCSLLQNSNTRRMSARMPLNKGDLFKRSGGDHEKPVWTWTKCDIFLPCSWEHARPQRQAFPILFPCIRDKYWPGISGCNWNLHTALDTRTQILLFCRTQGLVSNAAWMRLCKFSLHLHWTKKTGGRNYALSCMGFLVLLKLCFMWINSCKGLKWNGNSGGMEGGHRVSKGILQSTRHPSFIHEWNGKEPSFCIQECLCEGFPSN